MHHATWKGKMMKKWTLVLIMLVMGASLSLAQSSRENRDQKTILLGYTPIGLHIPTLLTQPLSLGIQLGSNLQIGVEYGSWEDSDTDENNVYQGSFSNAGMFVRWFPNTNSFYLALTGHQRSWSLDIATTLSTSTVALARMEANATVLGLGIGNQWMFGFGMYINVDWVVLSGAVSSSSTATVTPGALTASEIAEAKQELTDLGDALNKFSAFPGAVILTLGWAF